MLSILARTLAPDSGTLFHSKAEGMLRTALVKTNSLPPSFISVSHYAKIVREYHKIPRTVYEAFERNLVHFFKRRDINLKNPILWSLEYVLAHCPDVLLLDEPLSS